MYAGIGTSTPKDGGGCFQHFQQSGLYDLLNGDQVGLPLPAMIVLPVIGDMEKVTFDDGMGWSAR
jgi:hypothetical protein